MSGDEVFTIQARRCKRCGRLLTSQEAVERGYGCQCAMKAKREEEAQKPIPGRYSIIWRRKADMYYGFDDYFEPGEFDEKIEELKNELRESVKKEINDEIEKLRKENKELQGIKKNFESIKRDFERKKEECERVMKDAEYRAKHARLAELMEQMKLVLWSVTWETRYKRKCNKCDCWRNVKVTLPSGNTVSDTCICAKTARVYHPKENVLYEIADRGLDFRVWYKERGDKGKEYFIADTIAVIPSKIIDRNKNFEEINKKEVYGIFFTSFEECQEFCSYLNKKEGVAGYDYDREGNLIAESTGEDNE